MCGKEGTRCRLPSNVHVHLCIEHNLFVSHFAEYLTVIKPKRLLTEWDVVENAKTLIDLIFYCDI